jgi:hypothetical protein
MEQAHPGVFCRQLVAPLLPDRRQGVSRVGKFPFITPQESDSQTAPEGLGLINDGCTSVYTMGAMPLTRSCASGTELHSQRNYANVAEMSIWELDLAATSCFVRAVQYPSVS